MSQPPGHDPIPLSEYEPVLLSSKEQFDMYWPLAKPLIAKCIRRAMYAEIAIEDIEMMAQQQQLYIFVVKCDKTIIPSVKLVVVLDIVNYPRLAALNILALAGSDLGYFYKRFWKRLCGWAYMNNVRVMEGWVAPGMERIIERFGFKPAYKLMRYDLTED